MSAKNFQLKARKAMEILSREQMRGPRLMCSLLYLIVVVSYFPI